MKKLILGLIALSSLTFAGANDIKISSGTRFGTNLELKIPAEKGKPEDIEFYHDIFAETTVYELLKVKGNILYKVEHKNNTNPEVTLNDETSLELELNFKKFGTPFTEIKYAKDFTLGYKNSVDVKSFNANGEAKYVLNYAEGKDNLKHKAGFKIGASYDVLPSLNIFSNAKLDANFTNKEYSPEVVLGVKYYNIVKSESSFKYSYGKKEVKQTSEKNMETTTKYDEHSINLIENISYDYTGIKGLSVSPSFNADLGFGLTKKSIELNLDPKISVNYKILRGLSVNGSFATEFKFSRKDDTDKFNYTQATPKISVGLEYILN